MPPSRQDVLLSAKDMANQKGGLLPLADVTVSVMGSSAKVVQRNCCFSSSRIRSRLENSNSRPLYPASSKGTLTRRCSRRRAITSWNSLSPALSFPRIHWPSSHSGTPLHCSCGNVFFSSVADTFRFYICAASSVTVAERFQRLSGGSRSNGLWRSTGRSGRHNPYSSRRHPSSNQPRTGPTA